jgi:hypothetical protein
MDTQNHPFAALRSFSASPNFRYASSQATICAQRLCPIQIHQPNASIPPCQSISSEQVRYPASRVRSPQLSLLPFVHLSHDPRASRLVAFVWDVRFSEASFTEVEPFAAPVTRVASAGDELSASTTWILSPLVVCDGGTASSSGASGNHGVDLL